MEALEDDRRARRPCRRPRRQDRRLPRAAGDVGYTIVDGKPLAEPGGARIVERDGLRLAVLRKGDVDVVTWRRGGHTCVLASKGAGVEQLIRFATWT